VKNKGAKVVLFVPLEGCNPCINKMLKFAKSNFDNNNFIFVISDYRVKLMKIKLGMDSIYPDNLIIDSTALAIRLNLINARPVAYLLNENGIIKDSLEININNWEDAEIQLFK
jgi:hypothetical protein